MGEATSDATGRLVIGTRSSMLALTQSGLIAEALRLAHPGLAVTLRKFTTRGDHSQASGRPISTLGTKGLFTAELEAALGHASIDLAVHSAKDVPAELADGTALLAFPERADPRDALIAGRDSLAPASLATLEAGAVVGTSSLRRAGQLLAARPDLIVQPIRGNIETRIRKVREGQFAATLLAAAGLTRAGLLAEAAELLDERRMVPAAGQGVLALQGRADDARVRGLLAPLHHGPTARAVAAERRVVARLAGGCNMPLGVLAFHADARRLQGIAVLCHPTGSPRVEAIASADEPEALADLLVEQLLESGGGSLLADLRE